MTARSITTPGSTPPATGTAFPILAALGTCHLLNDLVQSLLPAIYPLLKAALSLDFAHVGLITLVNQLTASVLQPAVGWFTDRRPQPRSLVVGMCFTLTGLICLAFARQLGAVLAGAALVGVGSSVFHPESSRIARLASGGRHGLAQSLFQVGGTAGSALGPLLAAFIVLPGGQRSLAWFALAPVTAMMLQGRIGAWYARTLEAGRTAARAPTAAPPVARRRALGAVAVLLVLLFSKHVYLASIGTFYTFYLIETFHISVRSAQMHLFAFLGAAAVGTLLGGPIGDRIGRKYVIWGSILGVLPFTLALPYVGLTMTGVLSVAIGLVLASAFSAIVVYAQELLPGSVGMVAGLFFGLAFGIAGLGAAGLGVVADATSVGFVFRACAWLPALGLLTVLLPDVERRRS